ncbi:MAG: RagB/SusD family nutrient uptake outer membrane protein [Parabacteroides sp.]|nr:RagB/SusD family nutrient uptake outer membrane protein [Parabacteroides sp.]
MKKLLYSLCIGLAVLSTGCEDALDTTNYTDKTTGTFPESYADAQQMIAGIYQNLNAVCATPQQSFLYYSQLASDDLLGGGGANDKLMQAMDLICNYQTDMTRQFWKDRFAGVFRANSAIESLDNCKDYPSQEVRNQLMGEALFLRAFFYYELCSMYNRVPLVISSETSDLPQATSAELWGQILLDLKTAADLMPAQRAGTSVLPTGHADKYAAEAMLGRAWLFYTGMYCNGEDLAAMTSAAYSPLTSVALPDGSTLTKDQVASYIDDCVNNSGYSLVSDFRNLWAYTNKTTVEDFDFTTGKGLKWVENDGAVNPETVFAIKFNKLASWDTGNSTGYANGYALHFGLRGDQDIANTFPFGQGWGAGPVAPNLVNDWESTEPTDIRREATAYRTDKLPAYSKGGWADFIQETDYYAIKWSPVACKTANNEGSDYFRCFEYEMFGTDGWKAPVDDKVFGNIHDLVLIRFADVLLMQSELKGEASGLNKVRERAGLPAVGYSLQALQNERRWELACEGTRWNDMRRWHIAASALQKQNGTPIYNAGAASTNTPQNGGYAARYNASAGFMKIPESQISLSSELKQNDGWGADAEYNGWAN